jgi:tRNA(His) 5'-end guanylyltransferase
MNSDVFEARMREGEVFHSLRAPPGMWIVIRVDGRSFSRLTEERYEKPFDPAFHGCMTTAATGLIEELQLPYAYTESDEISVVAPPSWSLFDREVEKLASVSAGIASAAFTHAAGQPAHFDGRVWLGASLADVVDYFRWRQADAARCCLNGWCYWKLRQAGASMEEATARLKGISRSEKNELLFQHGINFNDVPLWQRRGTGVYWESFEKDGYNPLRQERVTVTRRRIKLDRELPMKEEYSQLLRSLLDVGPVAERLGADDEQ